MSSSENHRSDRSAKRSAEEAFDDHKEDNLPASKRAKSSTGDAIPINHDSSTNNTYLELSKMFFLEVPEGMKRHISVKSIGPSSSPKSQIITLTIDITQKYSILQIKKLLSRQHGYDPTRISLWTPNNHIFEDDDICPVSFCHSGTIINLTMAPKESEYLKSKTIQPKPKT